MIEYKVIYEDDEWFEIELTQPNDLLGNTEWWTEEDWTYWKSKMDDLEKNGTKGQLETIKVKLKKNPFIDGTKFIGEATGQNSTSEFKIFDASGSEESQGPEIQSE
jgi:hypothetical protein